MELNLLWREPSNAPLQSDGRLGRFALSPARR
jgi:hypothetical protein